MRFITIKVYSEEKPKTVRPFTRISEGSKDINTHSYRRLQEEIRHETHGPSAF